VHGKGEGGKMQLKKNDFEKFGRFEMKCVGRVIRTSPYWYEKSKERKRKETRGTRMAKRPDARESKKKIQSREKKDPQ